MPQDKKKKKSYSSLDAIGRMSTGKVKYSTKTKPAKKHRDSIPLGKSPTPLTEM